jgi:hypothetical protein
MVYQGVMRNTKGYFANDMQKEMDQQRLVRIVEAHNAQFCNRVMTSLAHKENSAGILEEKLSPSGTKIFARADFHSDLPSFIAQQNMLQGSGHLDASYRCLPNRLVYLLGDYIDRGINDIEMLSLLLTWRMENPNSVSLLRGNHEDVEISMGYSTDVRFLERNKKALSECFETFPLEACIASQEAYIKDLGAPQHQYLHLSHALFSPAKIVSSFLRGVDGISCIEKTPVFSSAERVSLKARRIFDSLVQKFQGIPEALHSAGCMWSDIGRETEPSSRGMGYVFSPDDIHQCFQASSGGPFKIFACLRGHEHMYQEHEVERKAGSLKGPHKVIATTLPVSMATGVFDCEMPFQHIQGLMLTVHPKGSAWTKSAVLAEIDEETGLPKFHIHEESIGMYEKFRPELNEGDHGRAEGETEGSGLQTAASGTSTEPRLLTAADLL